MFHARSKHIAVDYHYIRERVAANQVAVRHISSSDQLADLFTTPLPVSRFLFLLSKLLPSSPPLSLRGHDKDYSSAASSAAPVLLQDQEQDDAIPRTR